MDANLRQSLKKTIEGLEEKNIASWEKFAKTVAQRSYRETRELVKMYSERDEKLSYKLLTIIYGLGDLAMKPVMESLDGEKKEDFFSDLEIVIERNYDNRIRLLQKLLPMLKDKRSLKLPVMPPHIEEKPVPMRVCDKAYIMFRKLVSPSAREEFAYFSSNIMNISHEKEEQEMIDFEGMSDEERDKKIKRFMNDNLWIKIAQEWENPDRRDLF